MANRVDSGTVAEKRVVILTALRMEATAIAKRLGIRLAGPRAARVPLRNSGAEIELHIIGIGGIRLPDLTEPSPSAIIMAGLAGGLDPALSVGDVIVDEQSTWNVEGLVYRRGVIHTATDVAGSAATKADLFASTGALAVEMENARIRALAAQRGIPFLGIRAISDSASESVDPAVLCFVDPFGSVRLGALVGGIVRRPSVVTELRRLSRSSTIALKSLGEAVAQVIHSIG